METIAKQKYYLKNCHGHIEEIWFANDDEAFACAVKRNRRSSENWKAYTERGDLIYRVCYAQNEPANPGGKFAMQKLKNMLDTAHDFGRLPPGTTPYIVGRLHDIYHALQRHEQAEFIESDVYRILSDCGIQTSPRGIGWIAHPQKR